MSNLPYACDSWKSWLSRKCKFMTRSNLQMHLDVKQPVCISICVRTGSFCADYRAIFATFSLQTSHLILDDIFIHPLRRRGRGLLFLLCPSVHNQYFPTHFSQQPCITATSNLVWCFGWGTYTSLTEFTSASDLLPVVRLTLFSDITW